MKVKFKKGWIAMDKDGSWTWFENKPLIEKDCWVGDITKKSSMYPVGLRFLEIPKVKDWKKSLQEV